MDPKNHDLPYTGRLANNVLAFLLILQGKQQISRGQSNSPNNSDKMKLKQFQCCQLGGLKYIYSEIFNS
jgi:hypothetical protein